MDEAIPNEVTRLFEMAVLVDGRISDRKRRLFALACVRRSLEMLTDPRSVRAVVVAERYADGSASEEERATAEAAAFEAHAEMRENRLTGGDLVPWTWQGEQMTRAAALLVSHGLYYAEDVADYVRRALSVPDWRGEHAEEAVQCRLLRDIVGLWPPLLPPVEPLWLAAHDGAVVRLAQAVYDEQAFDLLPILADALEDAGCTDARLLDHCRQPGEHVRGCWVIDWLLAKQ